MSDKFNLKWNDFQTNISRTFSQLRSEEEFFDVTLVSDDQEMISAHKLVLSASSPYFKHILTQTKHSHPLLCLQGVDSGNLKTVLDYIYQGEAEVGHENLERFLSIAQMFGLDGLTTRNKAKKGSGPKLEEDDENEEDDETFSSSEEDIHPSSPAEPEEEDSTDVKMETIEEEVEERENNQTVSSPISLSLKVDSSVEQKILENIKVKPDGSRSCKVCGKNPSGKSAKTILIQHIETHLEGISYPCPLCSKTFR